MRLILRDRRILFASILLPILVTPLLMAVSHRSLRNRTHTLQTQNHPYAIVGDRAEDARALLSRTRERMKTNAAGFKFTEQAVTNAADSLVSDELHLIIQATSGKAGPVSDRAGDPPAGAEYRPEGESESPGVLAIQVVFRGDRDYSGFAAGSLSDALRETRRLDRSGQLRGHGFPIEAKDAGAVSARDVADPRAKAGLRPGMILTLLLFAFVMMGGAMVAADSLAGEKERGTLETLLTSAASRMEILIAKQLSILLMALLITLVQVGNLFAFVTFKAVPGLGDLSGVLTPGVVLLLFALCLPMAALASTGLLLVSGFSKTYKEAQMYLMPMMLVGLVPALAPMLPGASLRSVLVVLPMANLAVGVREVLTRQYDWPMLALAWLTTAGTAVWLMRWGSRLLLTERMITVSDRDVVEAKGGLPLFERHAGGWFAVIWACLLLASGFAEKLDLRLQLVINLVLIFFGFSCLILKFYRLPPREVLALRAPRPLVWLGVLIAAPAGFICALGAFQLANHFLPAPQSMVEQLSQTVFPAHIPPWQILVGISVLPGIFEEIAFRGILLHGLHRRLHPVWLVVVVGVTFGFFHVALFRFVPTAALGMMLAAVTLLTGSIFPAMLWHALSNALGVAAYHWQIPETGLELRIYALGAGLLGVAFWIFWRQRTPYPGLRSWRRGPRLRD